MKKCPFCAEEIQDEAIKCRWCGESLGRPPIDEQKNEHLNDTTAHIANSKTEKPLISPEVDPDTREVLFKSISRSKDTRYQTIAEFGDELKKLQKQPASEGGTASQDDHRWSGDRQIRSLPQGTKSSTIIRCLFQWRLIIPILIVMTIGGAIFSTHYFSLIGDKAKPAEIAKEREALSAQTTTKDFSQIRIELEVYNGSMRFEDWPVLFNRSIYIPGFGIVNYIRFNDNCRGECEVNFMPFQGAISSLSFLTVLKNIPALPADGFIMNYFEHNTRVDTSTVRKSDLQKNADAIDQGKGMSSYVDSEKASYTKSEYPMYDLLDQQREGFTKHNGVGDKMRSVINLPIDAFKKLRGRVTALYVPNMFAVFNIDMPLMSGDPLQFITLAMYNETGLFLYSKLHEKNNIKLMTAVDFTGQLALVSWRDYYDEALDSFTKRNTLDGKALFFKNGLPYTPSH